MSTQNISNRMTNYQSMSIALKVVLFSAIMACINLIAIY